jgi:nicotinamide-nucleotide amidase
MFPRDIQDLAIKVLDGARRDSLTLATAESCTGGLVIGALTAIAGSSDVVDRGFITYSNAAKTQMLGVDAALIAEHGAVSAEVALAMAEGALIASGANLAVAITGIAGPGGGSVQKPVGLVHFALAHGGRPALQREMRFGDIGRDAVRMASVRVALDMLLAQVNGGGRASATSS